MTVQVQELSSEEYLNYVLDEIRQKSHDQEYEIGDMREFVKSTLRYVDTLLMEELKLHYGEEENGDLPHELDEDNLNTELEYAWIVAGNIDSLRYMLTESEELTKARYNVGLYTFSQHVQDFLESINTVTQMREL